MAVGIYEELRAALIKRRRCGTAPREARVHPSQLKLMEAEFGVEHRDGKMFMETVLLVPDDTVPFNVYELVG